MHSKQLKKSDRISTLCTISVPFKWRSSWKLGYLRCAAFTCPWYVLNVVIFQALVDVSTDVDTHDSLIQLLSEIVKYAPILPAKHASMIQVCNCLFTTIQISQTHINSHSLNYSRPRLTLETRKAVTSHQSFFTRSSPLLVELSEGNLITKREFL